jgi:hypothetical protein
MTSSVDLQALLEHADILSTCPERVWSLQENAPQLFEEVVRQNIIAEDLYSLLSRHVPTQRQVQHGIFGHFVRPDRHSRAIYLNLDATTTDEKYSGCIAIKGAEPCAANFGETLEQLVEKSSVWELETGVLPGVSSSVNIIMDRLHLFLVGEGKLPGVVELEECKEDALQALEFQEKHLKAFGEIAHVPLPLFVFRWPDETVEKVKAILRPLVSPTALRHLQRLDSGLGVYIYYYPSVPYRMAHLELPVIFGNISYDDRKQALLEQIPDPDNLVSSWFEVVSRMLALGYTATDPCSWNSGNCLMPQNLVLDGGICDVNSLRQVSTITQEGHRRHSLFETVRWLDASVRFFLFGENALSYRFIRNSFYTYTVVIQNLQERLMRFRADGIEIDAHVEQILFDDSSLTQQFEKHLKGLSTKGKSF